MIGLSRIPAAVVAAALGIAIPPAKAGIFTSADPPNLPPATQKLKHLVFIVQENRSFDHFFGTFPGADGLPSPAVCQKSVWYPSACFTPYPNHLDSNIGGPYMYKYQLDDVDGGKMDGFVETREQDLGNKCKPPGSRPLPYLRSRPSGPSVDEDGDLIDEGIHTDNQKCTIDVMGYHTQSDIPNYWSYAATYVLFDHFYESVESYSLPAHLGLFSMWDAIC